MYDVVNNEHLQLHQALVNINKRTQSGFILTLPCKCMFFFHSMIALFWVVLIEHFLYTYKIITLF